jgi:ankyrin repeat protein
MSVRSDRRIAVCFRLLAPLATLSLGGCTSIYEASAKGYTHQVATWISRGEDPNRRSARGATPLLLAVANGRTSTVNLLLSRGADPNEPDAQGENPLACAVRMNFPYVAEALLEHGALVDKSDGKDGMTPLLLAAKNGDAAIIELLAAHHASLAAKSAGSSPLILALGSGSAEAVQTLLRRGVDPNEPDQEGRTPVQYATYANRPDLVALLLSFGAKPIGVQGRIGIGLAAAADDSVAVAWVAPDSPAAGAGIAKGDRFLEVNGESAAGWTLDRIAESLRGAAGTYVAITLRRDGERKSYTLLRQAVGLQAPGTGEPKESPAAPEIVSDVDAPFERAAPRDDDFALVIGIEDYQSLPKAEFAARDARAVRLHLQALGWPERNIVTLLGPSATDSKLKSYFEEWLPLNVKEDSTLFVYFSGHGAPDPLKGDAYLVPWDGDPRFLKSTAYPLKELYRQLAGLRVKHVLLVLDACFSGAGGRSVHAEGARPLVVAKAESLPESGRLTALAAAGSEEIAGSLDAQGHGLFTYYLLKGLSGPAKNARGEITEKGLFDYLAPRVEEEARRQNRVQVPSLNGAASALPLSVELSPRATGN